MKLGRTAVEIVMLVSLLICASLLWLEKNEVRSPFLPHYIFSHNALSGNLFVQGTWRREDGDDAYPTQTTTLECERTTKQCLEASAVIAKNLMLPVSINTLKISRWDDQFVVVNGPGALCVDETYTIDLRLEAVAGLLKSKAGCSETNETNEKPMRMRMVDGYKESQAIHYGRR
jgi:hypothetical protein